MIACITHDMPGYGCRTRGQHTDTCTGVNQRGDNCAGCAPAEATAGRLCDSCWRKLQQVHLEVFDYIAYLKTGPSTSSMLAERVQTSREPSIPIPAAVLAAHDLGAYVAAWYAYWGDDLRGIVTGSEGAQAAVELVREVQRIQHKWPTIDKPHRVPYIKCRACKKLGLVYRPPLEYLDELIVQCRYCHAIEPYELMLLDAMVLEQEQMKAKAGRKRS